MHIMDKIIFSTLSCNFRNIYELEICSLNSCICSRLFCGNKKKKKKSKTKRTKFYVKHSIAFYTQFAKSIINKKNKILRETFGCVLHSIYQKHYCL